MTKCCSVSKKLKLYGKSGTVRDYICVNNIARGMVVAWIHGRPGDTHNIGSGEARNNKDILEALEPLARTKRIEKKLNTLPHRKYDVLINVLDSSKLSLYKGWKIQVYFNEGIRKT
jgi:UDP-glucose 4-epimerase